MRIGIAIDYGKYTNATSLNLIAQKVFFKLGKLMNEKKNFTITAIKYEDIGIGDVNQHFDCILVPNMGGYRFPHPGALESNNLIVGVVGIDEVVLGEQVYKTKNDWKINKPIIEREVQKWEKYVNKIKFVHVSTNSDKEQLEKYLKVPEDKIRVIPYGVDHQLFKPASDKEKRRRQILGRFYMLDYPFFIHIGESNWARKNLFRILDAFEMAKKEGMKQNLIIVGRIDSVAEEKARKKQGIKIMGYVEEDELIALIQSADGLILPSLHEGFGFPLVESMACGTPVITSNVFSPPEIVGNAGLFADPYNVADIANKILQMANDKTLQQTLAQNALAQSKIFSWERTAKKLLKLIEETVDQKNNFDFEHNLDLAAYRTLVTVCEITPDLFRNAQQDLLEFNYSRIIPWALEEGLRNPKSRDFIVPFKEWLVSHNQEMNRGNS